MAFAVVHDVPASWATYAPVAAASSDPVPPGLILLAAGPTDEGVRIIGVWENEAAWRNFLTDRLAPAVASLEGPPPPPATERSMHAHLLVIAPRTIALARG